MANHKTLPLLILTGLLLPCFLHCSGNEPASLAGGLETTNGISVHVDDGMITGATTVPSSIIICDSRYTAPSVDTMWFSDTITTGETGTFSLSGLPDGTYTLIARAGDLTGGCVIPGITVGNDTPDRQYDTIPFVPLAPLTVHTLTDATPCRNATVFIRGTTFNAVTGSDGACTISEVPSGTYRIEAWYVLNKDTEPHLYTSTVDDVVVADTGSAILTMHLSMEF